MHRKIVEFSIFAIFTLFWDSWENPVKDVGDREKVQLRSDYIDKPPYLYILFIYLYIPEVDGIV